MPFRSVLATATSLVMLAFSVAWVRADEPPAVSAILTSVPGRTAYLAQATIWREPDPLTPDALRTGPAGIFPFSFEAASAEAGIDCLFTTPGRELGGNSLKFLCTTGDRHRLRVKYWDPELQGGNREVFAGVAASRLMWALGFATIHALPLNLQCEGCPRDPMSGAGDRRRRFYLAQLQEFPLRHPLILSRHDRDQGWSWRELDEAIKGLPPGPERIRQRTHFDALALLGVLIQHGDRKPEQQVLYCDAPVSLAAGQTRPWGGSDSSLVLQEARAGSACARAAAMVVDLGATFGGAGRASSGGGAKMNLEAWRGKTVFKDLENGGCRGRLTVSLAAGRDGLGDPVISDEGRRFLLQQLQRLSPAHLRAIFSAARVDKASGLAGSVREGRRASAIDDWVAAFQDKVQQIGAQRCQPQPGS
ncbi:MAG: hypothetical protein ABI868_07765 [Acidobacteriota bacterium]